MLKKCQFFEDLAERSIIAGFRPLICKFDILVRMDSLRVFSTFDSSRSKAKMKARSRQMRRSSGSGPASMQVRSLDEKPSVSRSEILEKLEKAKGPAKPTKVKGQRFGDGFMKEAKPDEMKAPMGDIKSNDPNDSMTTEKLKSMLNSNVVNFNGKEREVLSKILGQ